MFGWKKSEKELVKVQESFIQLSMIYESMQNDEVMQAFAKKEACYYRQFTGGDLYATAIENCQFKTIFICDISNFVLTIAAADGKVTEDELAFFKELFDDHCGAVAVAQSCLPMYGEDGFLPFSGMLVGKLEDMNMSETTKAFLSEGAVTPSAVKMFRKYEKLLQQIFKGMSKADGNEDAVEKELSQVYLAMFGAAMGEGILSD